MSTTVWVTRHSDNALLRICSDIKTQFEITCDAFTFSDNLTIPSNDELVYKTVSDTSYLIKSFSIIFKRASFTFYRGKDSNSFGLCDRITYNISSRDQTTEESLEFLKYSLDRFNVVCGTGSLLSSVDGEASAEIFSIHNACLSRLEDVNVRIAEHELKIEQELRKRYDDLNRELEREFIARNSDSEDRYNKRKKDLDEQEIDIKERERLLDNSDNTHARRAIRQDLLGEIRNRSVSFDLTRSTRLKRIPIHILCILSSVALLSAWVFCAYSSIEAYGVSKTTNDVMPLTLILAKQIGITALFASVVFFYIKWMNKWFEEHAREEFKIKQFQLDIDRASWLVETMLEWNTSQGAPIPDKLICNLSGNLFSQEKQAEDSIRHPGDILASSLLGTASRIKLNLPHAEIECDGKRVRAQMDGKGKS